MTFSSSSLRLKYMAHQLWSKIKKKTPATVKSLQNGHSKIDKKGLNDNWWLNEDQKYCRMLPLEHSAKLLTCI